MKKFILLILLLIIISGCTLIPQKNGQQDINKNKIVVEYDKNSTCPTSYNLKTEADVAEWVMTIQKCRKGNPFLGQCGDPKIEPEGGGNGWKVYCNLGTGQFINLYVDFTGKIDGVPTFISDF